MKRFYYQEGFFPARVMTAHDFAQDAASYPFWYRTKPDRMMRLCARIKRVKVTLDIDAYDYVDVTHGDGTEGRYSWTLSRRILTGIVAGNVAAPAGQEIDLYASRYAFGDPADPDPPVTDLSVLNWNFGATFDPIPLPAVLVSGVDGSARPAARDFTINFSCVLHSPFYLGQTIGEGRTITAREFQIDFRCDIGISPMIFLQNRIGDPGYYTPCALDASFDGEAVNLTGGRLSTGDHPESNVVHSLSIAPDPDDGYWTYDHFYHPGSGLEAP